MESTTVDPYSFTFDYFCLNPAFEIRWSDIPLFLTVFIGLPLEIFIIWTIFKRGDTLSAYRKCVVGQCFVDSLIIVVQLVSSLSVYIMCYLRVFVLLVTELSVILMPFQEFSIVISAVYWKTIVKRTRLFDQALQLFCIIFYVIFQMGICIAYYILTFILGYDDNLPIYQFLENVVYFRYYSGFVSFFIVFYTFIMVVKMDRSRFSESTRKGHTKMAVALLLQIIFIVLIANEKVFRLIQDYNIGKSSSLMEKSIELRRNGTAPLELEKVNQELNSTYQNIVTVANMETYCQYFFNKPSPLYKALITSFFPLSLAMGTTCSADSQWGAMKEGEDVACADVQVGDPRNWSTLPEDVLRRIFSMLPVADYLSLFGTSRFFYWFLMSQSKCHVPEETLIIHNGSLPPRKRYSPIWEKEKTRLTDIYSNRDWYFTQPRYLKKPFHVDDVYLFLHLGDFKGQIYDLCVSLIGPLREYCTNFNVTCVADDRKRINIAATDEFLKAVHATYFTACEKIGHGENERYNCIVDYNYLSQPYLHTINEITVMNTSGRPADGILLNPIGIYMDPPLTMVIKTLNVFLYGTSRLLFHCYLVEGLTAEEIIDFLCLNFPFQCLIEDGAIVWKRTIRSKYNSRVIKIWFSERNRRVQIHVGQADRFDGLHRRCFAYLRRSGEEQEEQEEEDGQEKQLAAGDGETEETDSGEEADTETGTEDEEDEEED